MGNSFYFIFEPEVIIFLQRILGEAEKYIATFLTYLGEDFLLVGILIFMYWCIDKRYARNIALLVIAGTAAGPMIKNIAKRRRPYMVHDEISCLRPPSSGDINDISIQGFSFPSGHSTNSTLLYGSLALRKGMRRILRIILIIIPLLVGLSRIILGVHYPTDVLGGYLLGIILIIFNSLLRKKIRNEHFIFLIYTLLLFPGFFWCHTDDYFTGFGMLLGFWAAYAFDEKYAGSEVTRDPLRAFVRISGGLIIFGVLSFLLKMPFTEEFLKEDSLIPHLIRSGRYAVIMFAVLGVYPLFFGKIKAIAR
ncbi:MAG: phosphatase PAP2 family protein [Clostridiales bacterium]|nr:phosphatase PAP2 family protein [Clostridiales bacterium]